MNAYYFLFAVLISFIFIIGIQRPIEASFDNYLDYTNYNNKFAIKYPHDWMIEDIEYTCSDFPSTKNVLTMFPYRNENKDKMFFFIDNLKNNNNIVLNDYAFKRLNFFKDFGNILQFETNSKLGNNTAYSLNLEYNPNISNIENSTNNSSTIIGEIGTLLDSKVYRITYTIEKMQYNNFKHMLEQIKNSFITTNIPDSQQNNETFSSWNSYNLKNKNNKYSINYDINGLGNSLIEIKPLISQADLLFKVQAPNDGSLVVEIPRKLFDSKLQNNTDYKFHISTDNKPNTPYEEISNNSSYRTLKIEIDDEDRIILIGGSKIDTGRTATINCNDLVFPPIISQDNEEKIINETTNKSNVFKKSIPLEFEGENYTIDVSTINNDIMIKNIEMLNVDTLLMDINSTSTGILEITIPRQLLDSKENGQDVPFSAVDNTVDIAFFPNEVKTNSQSRTLSIPYTNETTFIMINS
jgi:hypothetical protein